MTNRTTSGYDRRQTRRTALTALLIVTLLMALLPPPFVSSAAADETIEIKLLATNDFHGRIGTTASPRGAFLSTHLNAIRDAHPDTLYIDAGDLVGATPVLSNLFFDEPTVEVMNAIGLDIQTVGNHEFDRGQTEILRRRDGGCRGDDCAYRGDTPFPGQDYTTLSTNVTVDATGEALTSPYEIIEVGGVDVGFIGVTTENTPNVVHPDGVAGLTFHPEATAVNTTVPLLQAEGADIIVVLLHEGGRQSGNANQCIDFQGAAATIIPQFDPAVDVVVTGHTHQAYVCDLEDGPLVTQAGEYGTMYTEIDLAFDPVVGSVTSRSATNHALTTAGVTPDPDVLEIIAFYEELAGPAMMEIVGTSEVPIPRTTRVAESAQGNLATDALIDQTGVDFAFQNSGGLRANMTVLPQNDAGLYPIRRQDVLEVWPFGNIVALAQVDGPMLEQILANGVSAIGDGRFIQVGGLRLDYYIADTDGAFPRGALSSVEYWNHPDHADGTPVDLSPAASYTIALNDFMAAGGDGYPALGGRVYSLLEPLDIVVERYLQENSPVSPQVEGRIAEVERPIPMFPTTREECFKGGWQVFGAGFRNQGQCVSSVVTEKP